MHLYGILLYSYLKVSRSIEDQRHLRKNKDKWIECAIAMLFFIITFGICTILRYA